MPFNMTLRNKQKTDLWTFRKTDEALELQSLIDAGDRNGYIKRLAELILPDASGKKRQFARVDGVVSEMLAEGETLSVGIKFQVKNSVITWAFISPMDRTYQSFRDLVFNTAAKAHACVNRSCETYYRGTDHYHLKAMHTYAEESLFNHNHYRTNDGGPITPVDVLEHVVAFCAQNEGKQFIPSMEERDEIILNYAVYWADFNLDINYVAFSFMNGEGREGRVISQLEDIARAGTLTPDQADEQLDQFFSSTHGKELFKLAAARGFPIDDVAAIKNFIKENYRQIYQALSPEPELAAALDADMELQVAASPSSSGSRRQSPRDEYLSGSDQLLDEIDHIEYETFASDLTKHCQSIDKSLLEHLQLEDFRKGLLLYHALRTAQQVYQSQPEYKAQGDQRFHSDLMTDAKIKDMIKELPNLQEGSTEDELGATLLNRLLTWVQQASPKLDEWVDWVKVNGSRGLGSEIAKVRRASGEVDLTQAVPQGDRGDSKIAEIDFNKVDLKKLFLPDASPVINELNNALAKELKQLDIDQRTFPQGAVNKNEVFQSKLLVIEAAMAVLSGTEDVVHLLKVMDEKVGWDSTFFPKSKSRLGALINQVIEATVELGASPDKEIKY